MKITAAVARAAGAPFSLETLELEDPREDEVLVRVTSVGICHTDLAFRDMVGCLPMVFGHEGAGVVEKVGSSIRKVKPGDRVGLTFRSCGGCPSCAEQLPCYCNRLEALNFVGRRPDGSTGLRNGEEEIVGNFFGQSSFATYALAYETNLVLVPEGIDLDLIGPLGCGVQTGAGAIMNSLACHERSSVLILGGGSVGLSAVLGAVVQKCSVIIVVEPHPSRRALALELGATHVIDPGLDDLGTAIREIEPLGVDYAFDTTGRESVLECAINSLANHGSLGLVAAMDGPHQRLPGILASVIVKGITVKGIIEGDSDPDTFIPRLMQLYQQGLFPFDKLITYFPFSRINEAIKAQHQGDCVKAVLQMQ